MPPTRYSPDGQPALNAALREWQHHSTSDRFMCLHITYHATDVLRKQGRLAQ